MYTLLVYTLIIISNILGELSDNKNQAKLLKPQGGKTM